MVLLPTVGIKSRHRRNFTLAFLFLVFALFTAYGLYPLNWFLYRTCAMGVMIICAMIIVNYFGGYFAFWVCGFTDFHRVCEGH